MITHQIRKVSIVLLKMKMIQIQVYLEEQQLDSCCCSFGTRFNNKAIHEYKSSLKFQNLNEEKQNIQCQVVRGGRRMMISIFDIVVGDVIHLMIGDQVSADGICISSYSLSIDESSMTGESHTVDLMAGCKVADGCSTMTGFIRFTIF
ncbi:unnamed protein product [Lactuca saligna]|uniref:P-type ATPase A domain-containing protein n=1 Tax=Lactuca saligna TaxID=75948 RepID=A0AA35Z2C5_LACSI|nr:unnamed protein product [Lactuca saligna]